MRSRTRGSPSEARGSGRGRRRGGPRGASPPPEEVEDGGRAPGSPALKSGSLGCPPCALRGSRPRGSRPGAELPYPANTSRYTLPSSVRGSPPGLHGGEGYFLRAGLPSTASLTAATRARAERKVFPRPHHQEPLAPLAPRARRRPPPPEDHPVGEEAPPCGFHQSLGWGRERWKRAGPPPRHSWAEPPRWEKARKAALASRPPLAESIPGTFSKTKKRGWRSARYLA